MQYQVPQFIDTEDKVVGPFSIRQFAYVGIAAVVTGICYFLVQTWLFVIAAIIFLGGSLALSFVKINGRPLTKVVVSAFNFYWKPQMYVWKPDHPIEQKKPAPVAAAPAPAPAPMAPPPAPVRKLPPVATVALGDGLHKIWQNLQTGTPATPKKSSDRQFIEKKMAERYQIFQRESGERAAARRVDYR